MAARLKWDCSAVVFAEGESVVAEDEFGNVIRAGTAGADDADVTQSAIDKAHPAGEVRIRRGRYCFDKPVVIYNSSTIRGEGRGTVIVPPSADYAFKVMTTEDTELYRPFHGDPGPLYAVILRDLAIDGERTDGRRQGKGIYMDTFWCSSFENLWISNTGNALYMRHVRESDFSNIHLIANGDPEQAEASVIMTDENNNLHFRGLFVIYPNYIGLEMKPTSASDTEIPEIPRLVFISQSMFHGWLREEGAAPYDLIRIADLDAHRVGMLADVVIRDSRITVAGPGHASVNVINSPVTIANCVVTATEGKYVIRASEAARVRIVGNTFHSGNREGSKYALYTEDAEVIFKDNVLIGRNLAVRFAPASNSIVTDNRFILESEQSSVWVGDDGRAGSCNIQIAWNIFSEKRAESAIGVSRLSTEDIQIRDNQFVGHYQKDPVIRESSESS
jgi:hypothetical protein